MNKTALRHMMLNEDTLASEFDNILGYRTSHAGIVLPGSLTYGPTTGNIDDINIVHNLQNNTPGNRYDYSFVSSTLGTAGSQTHVISILGDWNGDDTGVWTLRVFAVGFDNVPDMAEIISATLRIRCTAGGNEMPTSIMAQVTPQPAVLPSAGHNLLAAPYSFTNDVEFTLTANQTDEIDVTQIITELIATPEWIAVAKPARLQIVLQADDVGTYTCTVASAQNSTAAYKPQLTIEYVPA